MGQKHSRAVTGWLVRVTKELKGKVNGVKGYCFEAFDWLHKPIVNALQRCIEEENVLVWMVSGRTVLIQKDSAKGTRTSSYRPFACLPLSGIFADIVYTHLLDNQLLPEE